MSPRLILAACLTMCVSANAFAQTDAVATNTQLLEIGRKCAATTGVDELYPAMKMTALSLKDCAFKQPVDLGEYGVGQQGRLVWIWTTGNLAKSGGLSIQAIGLLETAVPFDSLPADLRSELQQLGWYGAGKEVPLRFATRNASGSAIPDGSGRMMPGEVRVQEPSTGIWKTRPLHASPAALARAQSGSIEATRAALHDPDLIIRERAVKLLAANANDADVVPLLAEALEDKRFDVVMAAIDALIARPSVALPPLLKALETGSNPLLAAHGLGLLHDPGAVEPLIRALPRKDVCGNAGFALARIGDRRAIPALMDVLKNPSGYPGCSVPDVLSNVKDLHKNTHDDTIVPGLIALLGSQAGRTAEEFGLALKDLTGQSYGTNAAKWQKWYDKQARRQ